MTHHHSTYIIPRILTNNKEHLEIMRTHMILYSKPIFQEIKSLKNVPPSVGSRKEDSLNLQVELAYHMSHLAVSIHRQLVSFHLAHPHKTNYPRNTE